MAIPTKKEMSDSFDSATFGRGETYFSDDRVSNISVEAIDDDYVIIRSQVKGSGYSYTVEVSIENAGTYHTDIIGDCSCPVRYNCKHAVATCLAYQAYKPSDSTGSEDAAGVWLNNLVVASQGADHLTSGHHEFLAYLLDKSEQSGQMEVRLVECKVGKNGRLTKGRKISGYGGHSDNVFASPADNHIASLLSAMDPKSAMRSNANKLHGEIGAICLQAMGKTGRCFWQDTTNSPISKGSSRSLDLNWTEAADETHRLKMSTEPNAMLLDVSPPMYFDIKESRFGEITDPGFNEHEWHLLLNAPAVSATRVKMFSQQLVTAFPDSRIPPPQAIQKNVVRGITPVPCLNLRSEKSASSIPANHQAVMFFRYDDWIPPVEPALPVYHFAADGEIVSLSRDLLLEKSFIDELTKHGLVSQKNNEGHLVWSPGDESPLAQTEVWRKFLSDVVPTLEAKSWQVKFEENFSLEFVEADAWKVEVEADNDWFELGFDLNVGGQKVELLPLMTRLFQEYNLEELPEVISMPMDDGRYLQLPIDQIRPVYNILHELFEQTLSASTPLARFGRFDAVRLAELEDSLGSSLEWQGGEKLRMVGAKLKNFQGIEAIAIPKSANVELREYQQQGVDWLQFLREYQFNGILADDMGLGKTVQALIHLQIEKDEGRLDRPCLIIAPTSLMSNWRREAERFTPNLKVLTLQGSQRHARFTDINEHDIVLSTYPLVVRDQDVLLAEQYHYVILDEAQVIKNPRAKVSKMVRMLNARHRLCLTGTPMENHLGELWALFDFLMPGFLGDMATFSKRFRTPIEKHGDDDQQQVLAKRVAPFMLRRRKNEVVTELPAKTEMVRMVTFEPAQAALYESIRLSMEKRVREVVAAKGFARSHITILDALLKLRQTCCDPRLLKLDEAKKVQQSAKLELLLEMLEEMLSEGRRILVFSQFTQMLGLIENELNDKGVGYTKLTGQTRNRDAAIESFKSGEVDLFLISLKAGGVGLNLTEADTIIHYDPWWNPATMNQATDRAHRIGQDKPVFVYKLITENTLEEKIVAMQARKQTLTDGIYQNVDAEERFDVTLNDLETLLLPQGI